MRDSEIDFILGDHDHPNSPFHVEHSGGRECDCHEGYEIDEDTGTGHKCLKCKGTGWIDE